MTFLIQRVFNNFQKHDWSTGSPLLSMSTDMEMEGKEMELQLADGHQAEHAHNKQLTATTLAYLWLYWILSLEISWLMAPTLMPDCRGLNQAEFENFETHVGRKSLPIHLHTFHVRREGHPKRFLSSRISTFISTIHPHATQYRRPHTTSRASIFCLHNCSFWKQWWVQKRCRRWTPLRTVEKLYTNRSWRGS